MPHQAKHRNVLSLLAVDVLPTTAIGPAGLGSLTELRGCIDTADVLVQSRAIAEQLIYMVSDEMSYDEAVAMPSLDVSAETGRQYRISSSVCVPFSAFLFCLLTRFVHLPRSWLPRCSKPSTPG